jgi:hypothetical protein
MGVAFYMCCIIVSGFLSLTMSAIVRITVWFPSFFHQWQSPAKAGAVTNSYTRPMSNTDGTALLLRIFVDMSISPLDGELKSNGRTRGIRCRE